MQKAVYVHGAAFVPSPGRRQWPAGIGAVVILAAAGIALPARAQDTVFTNKAGSVVFDDDGNWSAGVPGSAPGMNDNAWFTNGVAQTLSLPANQEHASAFFAQPESSAVLTVSGGAFAWMVTNRFSIGHGESFTGRVNLASGSLVVTNETGTAVLSVGDGGYGTLQIANSTVVADHLFVTNNTAAAQNSVLTFGAGSVVNTLRGSRLDVAPGSLTTWPSRSRWNMTGGTNLLASGSGLGQLAIASGACLEISGPDTVWSNALACAQNLNLLQLDGTLVVSNGAAAVMPAATGRFRLKAARASLVVTGTNSQFRAPRVSDVFFGEGVVASALVDQAGTLVLSKLSVGVNRSYGCLMTVANGAEATINGDLTVGYTGYGDGGNHLLRVASGGRVFCASSNIGSAGTSNSSESNNVVLVTDSGSRWTCSGTVAVGMRSTSHSNNTALYNALVVTNGGCANAGGLIIGRNQSGEGNSAVVHTPSSCLAVTNAAGTAVISVVQGALVLAGGTVVADQVQLPNPEGTVLFSSGVLRVQSVTDQTGDVFTVGDGIGEAALIVGGGENRFDSGLVISSNACLGGSGTLVGDVTIAENGCLAPDGTLAVTGTVVLPEKGNIDIALPPDFSGFSSVLLSAETFAGATDLSGWTVGGRRRYMPVIRDGRELVVGMRPGTMFLIR